MKKIFSILLISKVALSLSGCATIGRWFDSKPDSAWGDEKPLEGAVLLHRQEDPSMELPKDYEWTVQAAKEQRDVVVGMEMGDVSEILGAPEQILFSGDPGSLNQKWIYSKKSGLSRMSAGNKVIYFENGLVSGWEAQLIQ